MRYCEFTLKGVCFGWSKHFAVKSFEFSKSYPVLHGDNTLSWEEDLIVCWQNVNHLSQSQLEAELRIDKAYVLGWANSFLSLRPLTPPTPWVQSRGQIKTPSHGRRPLTGGGGIREEETLLQNPCAIM